MPTLLKLLPRVPRSVYHMLGSIDVTVAASGALNRGLGWYEDFYGSVVVSHVRPKADEPAARRTNDAIV
jgi:hypothetical protein